MNRPLFVHVGSSKTATSSLQLGLWNSTEPLRAAGVVTPLQGRPPHVRRILWPLGWQAARGYVGQVNRTELATLGTILRRAEGERVLLSNEDLAEAPPSRIAALKETFPDDFDVHIIVSARSWAMQLPSEWQERLKERLTMDYESFLAAVRERSGPVAERFWMCQDTLDICERWGQGLDPGRVHVIPVPPRGVDAGAVYGHFGAIVGFDPASLHVPKSDVNASFGYTEAELVRQLNIALGDRVANYRHYSPAIRQPLVQKKAVVPRGASTRIPLPPDHVDWVRQTSVERVAEIVAHGFTVHGDLDLLVPDADVGREVPAVDSAELATVAIRTLANFALDQFSASGSAERQSSGVPDSRPDGHRRRIGTDLERRVRRLVKRALRGVQGAS